MSPSHSLVPFTAPPSLSVQVQLPHRGTVAGMGIRAGITLIAGGGFHGKSTLLQALEAGVYNKVCWRWQSVSQQHSGSLLTYFGCSPTTQAHEPVPIPCQEEQVLHVAVKVALQPGLTVAHLILHGSWIASRTHVGFHVSMPVLMFLACRSLGMVVSLLSCLSMQSKYQQKTAAESKQ